MLLKINNYKGVIIFYLLLTLTFVMLAYRSKQIDMHSVNVSNYNIIASN